MTTETTHDTPIASLGAFVIDCPAPLDLAAFYSSLTGWPVRDGSDADWAELAAPSGPALAFQRVDGEYVKPDWPTTERPQQYHLDFMVPDLDEAERDVMTLGVTKADHQPGTTFRVFLDPAGHPFCLCKS